MLGDVERYFHFFLPLMLLAFAYYWRAFVQGLVVLPFRRLLWFGISARVLALWIHPSDDIYRYVWEARVLLEGFNPYALAPDSPSLESLRDAAWPLINHPYHPAIYPPLTQIFFGLLATVSATPFFFKLALTLVEIPSLYLLRKLQIREGAPEKVLAVFFLNPLLIFEIAGRGHFESLLLISMLAFLVALPYRSLLPSALFLSVSILFKIISLTLLPLLFTGKSVTKPVIASSLILILVVPILALTGTLENIAHFGESYAYNAIIPYLWEKVGEVCGQAQIGTWGSRLLFLFCIPWVYRFIRGKSPATQALWLMGLLLLFLPTLHPWYLLWILPFASLRLSLPWLLLTGTISVNYFVGYRFHLTGNWQEVDWLRIPQYLPPLALGIFTWLRTRTSPPVSG